MPDIATARRPTSLGFSCKRPTSACSCFRDTLRLIFALHRAKRAFVSVDSALLNVQRKIALDS